MSSAAPVGDELKLAIKRQVEFYFSKANLATDAFLVSNMNSQMFVPVDVIVGFAKVKALTDSAALVVESVKDSKLVALNASQDAIKPNIKSERNTIILREIPSATAPADVEAIFAGCGTVESVRSDVGDTWFVTMASEDEAVSTLLALRSKTFNGVAIKARLKSENTLKSFYPAQVAEPISAAPGAAYGGRGYYGAAPVGYYDVPNHYGVQYQATAAPHAPYSNGGGADNRYTQPRSSGGGRGNAAAGSHHQGRQQSGRGGNAQQQQPQQAKEGAAKGTPTPKKQGKKGASVAAKQAPASSGAAKKAAGADKPVAATERQPILSASNFPPLPANADKPDANAPIQRKYQHEDIMEIVKHMDESDCKLPAGKMDFDAHPAALTAEAHPDLLRNQRTYSIEQAREAMRQGRPIRSDSVGSIDYESMMYGEEYTKEAREQRKQTQSGADKATAAASKDAKPAAPKVFSFASAVINGAPAPPMEPKKPVAAAPASSSKVKAAKPAATKDEKKPAVAKKAAPEPKKVVDESLPTAGAWGGRNFLDVVKSEPAVAPPPAAPVKAAAPVQEAPKRSDAKVWERNAGAHSADRK
ncbi:hypothetical protein PybrP1_000107 [[Pythium] brassicae (nom. inval.)]|nr:hypothetical protein PybrP1_000107 [[Pythium] brassicae (nom. inval.)]